MDLVGVGFTHDKGRGCDPAVFGPVAAAVAAGLTDDELEAMEFITAPEGFGTREELVDLLVRAAEEYASTVAGHRSTVHYGIPGTSLEFVFAGGGSWGDDPYDGFSDLVVFVDACDQFPVLAAASGLVCQGLPGPAASAAR